MNFDMAVVVEDKRSLWIDDRQRDLVIEVHMCHLDRPL